MGVVVVAAVPTGGEDGEGRVASGALATAAEVAVELDDDDDKCAAVAVAATGEVRVLLSTRTPPRRTDMQ